ncbi:ChaN family lipoprotein [Solemya velesiana gill symbiont]|uniref:PDZ domain-containing protein n=1 Tax=Solemya velesiana gill symbiont TaxID=1918948 RepID=A0A1T2KNX1_9GAMM|nr:ChaN family lipoprotein [Solemya velesiana gill symbiont]OOZ34406.1 hypothetical protein BOW51_12150 [Solemya velesiana gill symbiont]
MVNNESPEQPALSALDLRNNLDLDAVVSQLDETRVVYVGEIHDNYGHHLAQLEIIKGLHQRDPDIAIGMEMFQQPYQPHLDTFISGETDEHEMLRRTEWYDRWRFDYRLYKPILDYAREHAIPLVAMNVTAELKGRVSEVGIDGLNAEERAAIPAEIDKPDVEYRARLKQIFIQHMARGNRDFERFVEVQLLWDESMAESAARYLEAHPDKKLVVLAGGGHLMYGSGIPNRVDRRVQVTSAIILPGDNRPVLPGVTDFMIYPQMASLPQQGLMGLFLDKAEKGVRVAGVIEESAAQQAGLEKDDVILVFQGEDVRTPGEIKVLLTGKMPGDRVSMKVLRKGFLLGDEELAFEFPLGK